MDIVILGGGYAGISCALRIAWRARRQRAAARIRVVNPRRLLVERIRLHQAATGQRLRATRLDELLGRQGVELVVGEVQAVDRAARTVCVDGTAIHWDRLVIALGSRIGTHRVPGVARHGLVLEPGTTRAVRARLESLGRGSRVAVVGGGLTAIEAASEIAEAFPLLHVHLVSGGRVAEAFSARARRHVVDTLGSQLGVAIHEGTKVRAMSASHLETDRGAIAVDACVWAAGFESPPPVAGLNVAVNAQGRILVDSALRSISDAAIYAAGDIASPVVAPGQALPMGCKSAMPMGAHAGDNLARELSGAAPAAFDYALLFYCVSLGRRDGLIQWADDEGRLTGRILTGRPAALFKELICRSTLWALELEARGHAGVVWKRTGHAPTLAAMGTQTS